MSELQADVRIKLAPADLVQQLMVKLSARAGLCGVGNILAKVVEGCTQSRLVEPLCGMEGILNLSTGHKTAGQALPKGRTFGDPA